MTQLETFSQLLNAIPSPVVNGIIVLILSQFTTLGGAFSLLIKKIVDHQVLLKEVADLKVQIVDMKKDLDAEHDKIRDLEAWQKTKQG